jgi:hypothetical protein
MINRIISALSEDLLKPEFRKKGMPKTYGHCYIASEALYHLCGKDMGYKPFHARDDDGIVHWWLQKENNITKTIMDPTASQYTDRGLTPPYVKGRKGGFLTKEPSLRTKILMVRVMFNGQRG